jgi:hypothetical protein
MKYDVPICACCDKPIDGDPEESLAEMCWCDFGVLLYPLTEKELN